MKQIDTIVEAAADIFQKSVDDIKYGKDSDCKTAQMICAQLAYSYGIKQIDISKAFGATSYRWAAIRLKENLNDLQKIYYKQIKGRIMKKANENECYIFS